MSVQLQLLLLLSLVAALVSGKQVLLATVLDTHPDSTASYIATVNPTNGNVSKLYQLPPAVSDAACTQPDSKTNSMYVVVTGTTATQLLQLHLSDGRLLKILNITESRDVYEQWDYDPEAKTLYGICFHLNESTNYLWCYTKFNESGSGKTKHGFHVATSPRYPFSGWCSRVSMNRDTPSSGQYWYGLDRSVVVRHVTSLTGQPGETLWYMTDQSSFQATKFAALVTGVAKEYAVMVRAPVHSEGFAVVRLGADGKEDVIAQLPEKLTTDAPGRVVWDYDPTDKMLHLLMRTSMKDNHLSDTLIQVNLTQAGSSGSSSFRVLPVPLKSLFDPKYHVVSEAHLVDWPPS